MALRAHAPANALRYYHHMCGDRIINVREVIDVSPGITVYSPAANGLSVMNASTSSSSWIKLTGERPAMISQKTQVMVRLRKG